MTILTFPSINNPSQITWRLRANTQTQRSPWDGTTQTLRLPGERWEATLVWETLKEDDWRLLSAFIAQLGGMAGRFYYGPVHSPRRATGTGTPLVNGSIQTGTAISIKGWDASAQAFKAGDFFSVNDSNGRPLLYQATTDSAATNLGVASVSVAPPVRRSVADNTAVAITSPVAVFMLASTDAGITHRPGPFGGTTLEIAEALV